MQPGRDNADDDGVGHGVSQRRWTVLGGLWAATVVLAGTWWDGTRRARRPT